MVGRQKPPKLTSPPSINERNVPYRTENSMVFDGAVVGYGEDCEARDVDGRAPEASAAALTAPAIDSARLADGRQTRRPEAGLPSDARHPSRTSRSNTADTSLLRPRGTVCSCRPRTRHGLFAVILRATRAAGVGDQSVLSTFELEFEPQVLDAQSISSPSPAYASLKRMRSLVLRRWSEARPPRLPGGAAVEPCRRASSRWATSLTISGPGDVEGRVAAARFYGVFRRTPVAKSDIRWKAKRTRRKTREEHLKTWAEDSARKFKTASAIWRSRSVSAGVGVGFVVKNTHRGPPLEQSRRRNCEPDTRRAAVSDFLKVTRYW